MANFEILKQTLIQIENDVRFFRINYPDHYDNIIYSVVERTLFDPRERRSLTITYKNNLTVRMNYVHVPVEVTLEFFLCNNGIKMNYKTNMKAPVFPVYSPVELFLVHKTNVLYYKRKLILQLGVLPRTRRYATEDTVSGKGKYLETAANCISDALIDMDVIDYKDKMVFYKETKNHFVFKNELGTFVCRKFKTMNQTIEGFWLVRF
jgi:hypothetical protein